MTTGTELRELRHAARIGLTEFANRAGFAKSYLANVETGRRRPTDAVIAAYERVLGCSVHDGGVNRRMFLTAAGAAAANAVLIGDLGASLAGGDASPLRAVQTSNAVDHALAAAIDRPVWRKLARWSVSDDSPVARVNALGIVAKAPGQSLAGHVATVLDHDLQVRDRYMRAVVARVLGVDHETAAEYITAPARLPAVHLAAQRLAAETVAPNDSGARWCAATMLARISPYTGKW